MDYHHHKQDQITPAGPPENPLTGFVRRQGLIVLDGGLATALEALGHDLNDPLWSAKVLLEEPSAIGDLHQSYLNAGADCITTATYQASLPGFIDRGMSEGQGCELMRLAVRLAAEARNRFWAEQQNRTGRLFPLVAAGIGPYGAYLADGSEYRGDYDISDSELYDFHRPRWLVLAAGEADLLACETIPSGHETAVLLQLLAETPDRWAWLSFSCRDAAHLCDGTPLRDVVQACHAVPNIAAVGINCTAPGLVTALITEARSATDKMIIVYPNLGERYDGVTKMWGKGPSTDHWLDSAGEWARNGAVGVGGCCRIGPRVIGELRQRLLG